MPRPTSLIAFRAPYVKGADGVAVSILTSIGDWGLLVGTAATMRDFGQALVDFSAGRIATVAPSHANPSVRQPIFKPKGRIA